MPVAFGDPPQLHKRKLVRRKTSPAALTVTTMSKPFHQVNDFPSKHVRRLRAPIVVSSGVPLFSPESDSDGGHPATPTAAVDLHPAHPFRGRLRARRTAKRRVHFNEVVQVFAIPNLALTRWRFLLSDNREPTYYDRLLPEFSYRRRPGRPRRDRGGGSCGGDDSLSEDDVDENTERMRRINMLMTVSFRGFASPFAASSPLLWPRKSILKRRASISPPSMADETATCLERTDSAVCLSDFYKVGSPTSNTRPHIKVRDRVEQDTNVSK